MKYNNTRTTVFLNRPNRFTAQVKLDGEVQTVHVKNTGRCAELLFEGADVMLCKADNPRRKTAYDLISVRKEGLGWVNLDSQVCNDLFEEWLQASFPGLSYRREVTHGTSRFDFRLEGPQGPVYVEIKGCSLERNGRGWFPDAPTARGRKHLEELAQLARQGTQAILVYVIVMNGIHAVQANIQQDPAYASALVQAQQAGVQIWHASCHVEADQIVIEKVRNQQPLFS